MPSELVVMIWAEHATQGGQVCHGNARNPDSEDIVTLTPSQAWVWARSQETGPHGSFLRRAGRNALDAMGIDWLSG